MTKLENIIVKGGSSLGLTITALGILQKVDRDPDIVSYIGLVLFGTVFIAQIVRKTPLIIIFVNMVMACCIAFGTMIVGSFTGYDLAYLDTAPVTGRILVMLICIIGTIVMARIQLK